MERGAIIPHVTVILLNWNGWKDSIECLETLLKQTYENLSILIVDNGSDDDSVQKIISWAKGELDQIETRFPELVYPLSPKPLPLIVLSECDKSPKKEGSLFLLPLKENLGFARGMNVGIDCALKYFPSDYIFLLNNDTVLERQTISQLIRALQTERQAAMAQATIYYYDKPQQIANAGGRILPWGQTKYYKTINPGQTRQIEFINGCALCLPRLVIKKYGKLTEKFFFGEEDFELSLRAKKNNLKLIAVGDARVYHKIAASSEKQWQRNKNKILIFALNRTIDMKDFLPRWQWELWRIPAVIYFGLLMLYRYRIPLHVALKFVGKIWHYSSKLEQLNKQEIEQILNEN